MNETPVSIRVTVEIISDYICPWCYLAFAQVLKAKERLINGYGEDLQLNVKLLPHLLRPQHLKDPTNVLDKKEMYMKGFKNNKGKLMGMKSELSHLFSLVDLTYSVEGKVGHTLHAHRILQYLQNQSNISSETLLQASLNIFKAYHSEGKALNNVESLLSCCETIEEINIDNLKSFLESKELVDETLNEIESLPKEKRFSFTRGVPHILLTVGETEYVVPGAQETDYFVRMIKQMIEKEYNRTTPNI